MVLYYLATVRLPTEKAHGVQIVENCEALAAAGLDVTLLAPRRRNTPSLQGKDLFAHYGVNPAFTFRQVAAIDVFPLGRWLEWLAFPLLTGSFSIAAAMLLRRRPRGVVYSRDMGPLLVLAALGHRSLVYEVHQASQSRLGRWLQRRCIRRAQATFAVTRHLAGELHRSSGRTVETLPDGYRAERFRNAPEREEARRRLALPSHAFIIGYVGRLETLGQSKGLDTVVAALAQLGDASAVLHVVGGPADQLSAVEAAWRGAGLPAAGCSAAGEVPAPEVPVHLAACDVCVLPLPWSRHFAYHASPLKLFEYMAAGRAIVASDLPAHREVLEDGRTALLTAPGDARALASALRRLRDDPALRARLGSAARAAAAGYAWDVRANRLSARLRRI